MKKCLATILAVLYFMTSTGATIHMHYCMGKMVSWALWHKHDKKDDCKNCSMAKKKGCCEDKHQTIEIEGKYNFQAATFSPLKIAIDLPQYDWNNYALIVYSHSIINYPLTNSPPGTGKVPLYISHCVYRI